MKEKTPCEDLGYKVGDKFIVLQSREGFNEGQIIHLYKDDKTDKPLFIGQNYMYNNADGKEGAYLELQFVKKLIKEREMFDIKKQPWFIRVNNKEEWDVIQEWLKINFGQGVDCSYGNNIKLVTNVDSSGEIWIAPMWGGDVESKKKHAQEIKVTFKTVVDSVEYPVVKSPEQQKVEELEQTIKLAQEQLAQLKEQMQ